MEAERLCKNCSHYTPPDMSWPTKDGPNDGLCDLMKDSNEYPIGERDMCRSEDGEGYWSRCLVGPEFGCIHWSKKENT